MIKIGAYNELKIIKQVDFGFYLDGFEEGEILLPRRYATDEMQIGDTINVFLYFDSEDRLIATTQRAKAEVNKFASLKVIDTNRAEKITRIRYIAKKLMAKTGVLFR